VTPGTDDEARSALLALAAISVIGCGLVLLRMAYTGRATYLFLCWNLFLAWVPAVVSLLLGRWERERGAGGRPATWALGGLWLAFFPNAPYLVTDRIHLRARSPIPLWTDTLLVFTFALLGLGLAFVSLRLVHRLVEARHGARAGWLFVIVVAALTGLGIYLGRFLRWNSWDLVLRPTALVADVQRGLVDPLSQARAAGIAALFGTFFGSSYLVMFALSRRAGATVRERR
jgi:uncharacterized membrane protein